MTKKSTAEIAPKQGCSFYILASTQSFIDYFRRDEEMQQKDF